MLRLLIDMYLDVLAHGDLVWDADFRKEHCSGDSLPPIAQMPNQCYQVLFWLAVQQSAAQRRSKG